MPIAMTRAIPSDRMRDIAIAGSLILWLAYTRIYWMLQAAHLSAPPCPLGHQCSSIAFAIAADLPNAMA